MKEAGVSEDRIQAYLKKNEDKEKANENMKIWFKQLFKKSKKNDSHPSEKQ